MFFDGSYGVDMNVSMVFDEDGKFSIGCHYTDSKGRDIACDDTGYDCSDVINKTVGNLLERLLKEEIEEEEKENECSTEDLLNKIRELESKVYSLELDNEILTDRLAERKNNRTCRKLEEMEKDLFDSFDKIDWHKYLVK